jgi:DNA polymerase (family X)
VRNSEIASVLDEIADLLDLKGESRYKVAAYRAASSRIGVMSEAVEELWRSGRLEELPGVGQSIAAKIGEYLQSDRSAYLEALRAEVGPSLRQLLLIPGMGPSRARFLHRELGVQTIEQLAEAARQQRIRELPGLGAKTEERILREIERLSQRTHRMLLGIALPAAEEVVGLLKRHPAVRRIHVGGSLRRMEETIGDIDLIASSEDPAAVTEAFARLPMVWEVLGRGDTKASVLTRGNLQMDLRVVEPGSYGAALQYFTGNKPHNIALRDIAIRKGYKLNEYGLFDEKTGRNLVQGEEEIEIYRALGLEWMPPEMRTNRGEIQAAAVGRLPRLIIQKEIRGDLQMHTKFSDGSATLEQMAIACLERGYQYAAVTDHSRSLGVAGGLSMERLRQQRIEIDELNERLSPFRLLAGSEVDILADGSLDFPDEVLAELDFVVVAVHSGFGQSRERVTERVIRALRNPYVDLLAHPTGRLIERRDGYEVDVERVLQAAAGEGVAVEINAAPDRLDLNDTWARRAKELGVMLAINTDAHAPSHLDFMRYGVAVARRAWIERGNVLNALPLEKLLARRRGRLGKAAA